MYYSKDSNVNYYKYALPSNSMVIKKNKNTEFLQTLKGVFSYVFSTFFLALFLIIGYLFITKQERILYWQLNYILFNHSTSTSNRYTVCMSKWGRTSLRKQEIVRIEKILTNCNSSKNIDPYVKKKESIRTIVVKEGDTLYTLAEKAYGNASYYQLIFDANPKILKSKRDLKIGQVLRVPF